MSNNKKHTIMKKITTFKKMMATALMVVAGSLQGYAYNNVWVKAEAYPTGAGKVYVTQYNPTQPDDKTGYEPDFQDVSEFKRSADVAASTAFLDYQPAEGYIFAGIARDNGDGVFGEGDEQVRRREEDGNFTAVYDPTEYNVNGSSSQSMAAAEEALAEMENPTDHVFGVFTKGDAGRVVLECSMFQGSDMGKVVSSKLDNQPGEEVTFTALPDSKYCFVKWTDAEGNVVSTKNPLTVTAQGGVTYYAHFAKAVDGIEEVQVNERADPRWFDLQGRQYATPRRGLYIHNGRKVFVK